MISRIKSLLIIYLLFATNVISGMAINNIFINSKIIEIEKDTNKISFEGDVNIKSGLAKDSVQMDKRNTADSHILGWWIPKTGIDVGIRKVFDEMKKNYGY